MQKWRWTHLWFLTMFRLKFILVVEICGWNLWIGPFSDLSNVYAYNLKFVYLCPDKRILSCTFTLHIYNKKFKHINWDNAKEMVKGIPFFFQRNLFSAFHSNKYNGCTLERKYLFGTLHIPTYTSDLRYISSLKRYNII